MAALGLIKTSIDSYRLGRSREEEARVAIIMFCNVCSCHCFSAGTDLGRLNLVSLVGLVSPELDSFGTDPSLHVCHNFSTAPRMLG